MTDPYTDPDLRGLFQELRETDLQDVPAFSRIMAEAGRLEEEDPPPDAGQTETAPPGLRPMLRRRAPWAVSLLAAAAAAALLLLPPGGTSDDEFERVVRSYMTDPAGGAWRSPTDGLLRVPGSDVLSTLPKLRGSVLPTRPGTRSRPNTL